jgi:hypothetical protein
MAGCYLWMFLKKILICLENALTIRAPKDYIKPFFSGYACVASLCHSFKAIINSSPESVMRGFTNSSLGDQPP